MRALLVSPRMPHSFWSLDETVKIVGKKHLLPPLGLLTMAALLPRHWELKLVNRSFQRIGESLWHWADVVMISAMLVQREDLFQTIREAKLRDKTVVIGGPYATSVPEESIRAGADFVVRGEAEASLPAFLAAFAEGATGGVFDEPGKPDLEDSPIPRFDLIDPGDYGCAGIQTSRGCPHDCEFCDVVSLNGRKPRYKGPTQVTAELEVLHSLGWKDDLIICDDNFIGNRKRAQAILRHLTPWMENHGKPFTFWTQTSVELGRDLELINLMTEANFSRVLIGIETPDRDVLVHSRKYHNTVHPLAESVRNITANGLTVIGSFIIGFDHELRGAGERILALVEETHLPMAIVSMLQALPNTALWNRLEREGRLLRDRPLGNLHSEGPNFTPTRPLDEVWDEYHNLSQCLYEPSRYLRRAYRYYLTMRPTRWALARKQGRPLPVQAQHKGPLWQRFFRDLGTLTQLIWRQGIVSRCRVQFWEQLLGIYRNNPSRMVAYLTALIMGESMFRLRGTIPGRLCSEGTSVRIEHNDQG